MLTRSQSMTVLSQPLTPQQRTLRSLPKLDYLVSRPLCATNYPSGKAASGEERRELLP